MAIHKTTTLTYETHAEYHESYIREALFNRFYDQYALPFPGNMADLMKGSSVNYTFLSDMNPGTAAISETADVTPQTLRDATASITSTSRGEAMQWSEESDIQHTTNLGEERAMKLGKNQAESVDLLAQAAALQGTFVYRAAARASLDAGTPSHRASDALFGRMQGYLQSLRVPGFITADGGYNENWAASMHPYIFHDIRESGNVDSIGLYQNGGIHLNFELGKIGPFRILSNAWAKVLLGTGADNATSIDTTLNGAVNALATSMTLTTIGSAAAGMWFNIGTEETANTHYSTNERVYATDVTGSVVTFLGEGPNGGLRFDHATLATVNNSDSVYPIVFGGPFSLVKLFAVETGEFGTLLPAERVGTLKQWVQQGWKWWGGFNRLVDNRILRVEVSTSYEA